MKSLTCVECGVDADREAAGWRAYLSLDDELPMYCPSCAAREFGPDEPQDQDR